jgi:serine protease Do
VPQVIPSVVKLYRHAPAATELAANVGSSYFSEDLVGEALVVTADGWLLTYDANLNYGNLWAVAYDKKGYKVEKFVRDGFSHLIFLKIQAENLSSARLGESRSLSSGDYLFFPDDDDNLTSTAILTPDYYSEAKNDVVRSSEKLNRQVLLRDGFKKSFIGAPIFNIRGEAVAIFSDNGNYGIPVEVVNPILSSFLKNGKIIRPTLGVYYANISLLKNQPLCQKLKTSNGALVWRAGDTPFAAKSVAKSAGLRENDVIVKIESDTLNTRRDLAEVISEYEIGTKLNLGIMRDGQEIDLSVILQ